MLYVRKLGLRETTSRPLGRIGIGGGICYVCRDRPRVCPTPMLVRYPIYLPDPHASSVYPPHNISPFLFAPNLYPVLVGRVRTDTGSVPTCGLMPELASTEFRGPEKQNPRNLTLQDGCGDSYTDLGLLYLRRPKVLMIAR